MLNSIEINSTETLIKNFKLDYADDKCTLLKNIDGGEGNTYGFEYNTKFGTDPFSSWTQRHSQDMWGYYNNKNNQTLTPKTSVKTYSTNQDKNGVYRREIGEADRSIDSEAMQALIITKIIWPTGGTSAFEYEPHKFVSTKIEMNGEINPIYDPYLKEGGGLRIKKITTSDGESNKDMTVKYVYPDANIRSIPSTATFIETYDVVFAMPDIEAYTDDPIARMRMVNIMPISDYMRYDIGVLPLWYEKVTAIWDEGKTETYFKDYLDFDWCRPIVNYGNRIPAHMSHVFDGSPVMTKQIIFKTDGNSYIPVETNEFTYESTLGQNTLTNYHVRREIVYTEPGENNCPDLIDGHLMYGGPKAFGALQNIENAYSTHFYGIYPYVKRLTSKTHTLHTETGDIATTESYSYKNGTGLIESVITSTSEGNTTEVKIGYPDKENGGIEATMVTYNAVGVPLRETIKNGSAQTYAEAEYVRTASGAFRQRTSSITYGNSDTKLLSPVCEFTSLGNLKKTIDADGITTEWTWDAQEIYPVAKNTAGLETRFEYKPLVGLSGLTLPFGAATVYQYDSMNRLKATETVGLGKIQEIFYNFAENDNFISVSSFLDAARIHTLTEHYDNLGRKTASVDNTTGLAQYFKYDAMGRCYATSVPSAENPSSDYDYAITFYERSPRGVAASTVKNGEEWHKNAHHVTMRTVANQKSGTLSCPMYEVVGNNNVAFRGNYAAGQLIVEETTDENGHMVRQYTNKSGLVVMTEEGDGNDMLRTRNIYDHYGRLRFILPPSFADGSFVTTDESFTKNCYEFEYDELGRLVSTRNPGAKTRKRTVYSAAGRVVAEHTPAMGNGNWFVHFYDNKGRLCYTADASLIEIEVEELKHTFAIAEYNGNAEYAGYKLSPTPPLPVDIPFSAAYYDDYRFLNMADASTLPKIGGNRAGLQTGAYDASTGFSAMVYDDWGRLIATHAKTAKGIMSSEFTLDRSGAPLSVTTTLNGLTLAQTNGYDAAGRLTQWNTRLNNSSASGSLFYGPLGHVIKENFGNSVSRAYAYDCHGWIESISTSVTQLQFTPTITGDSETETSGISEPFYLQAFMTAPTTNQIILPRDPIQNNYTEKILYADGLHPLYNGTASAHVSTLGGRYDYTFDNHHRLVKAAYSDVESGTKVAGRDFSAEYTYNEVGAPLSVKRYGANDIFTGLVSVQRFGLMDDLTFDWDGMQLTAVDAAANGSEFYGRTGYTLSAAGGRGLYSWNDAGLLYSDSARGIKKTIYKWNGLPATITFDEGGSLRYTYRADGTLKSVSTFAVLTPGGQPKKVSERSYIGNFVFEGDSLLYVNFAGGYFDGNGQPHYRHPDWQGNTTMVTDAIGKVEQHTGYYPYGEPWSEPSGQPWLYGGKERMRDNGLNEYDFSARRLNSALCLWTTPDPLAPKFANTNPYAYCASNPIRFIDPTGCVIEGMSKEDIKIFKNQINTVLSNSKFDILKNSLTLKGRKLEAKSEKVIDENGKKTNHKVNLQEIANSISMNEDERFFVNTLIDAITNSKTIEVQYINQDESVPSQGEPKKHNITVFNSNLFQDNDGGLATQTDKGAYTLISKDSPLIAVYTFHEVLGHGVSFLYGIIELPNDENAVRMENLVRRILNMKDIDGTEHHKNVVSPYILPLYK